MSAPIDEPALRRSRILAQVVLTLATVGLGTSALMLYLYLSPQAGACGPGGGCDAVRTSEWSVVVGVPLPWLGLGYFGLLTAAVLVPALRKRWLLAALGLGGMITGAALLVLQGAVIGAWCPYCVVVDVCSLGAGLAVMPALAMPRLRLLGGPLASAFGLGAAVPMVLSSALHAPSEPASSSGPAPELIAATQVEGRATIVEFIDFECPFCRRQHARMARILADLGEPETKDEPVRVVYKHLPLAMHPHAREAARFACCAEEQGHGEAMVHALFSRDELSSEACLECASEIGLDDGALRECLGSTRPDDRLDADAQDARTAGVRRLPTCFVGEQRFEGLQEEGTLRQAIEHAMTKASAPT
jgi:predicted DsbA family dithiol-disulfide isomerase/uncharacterized membrane protein